MNEYGRKPVQSPALRPPLRSVHPAAGLADGHKTVPLSKQKADNQMEWVRQMNACKAQAEAIVKFELIYD